jgi:prefoldin subunit 5
MSKINIDGKDYVLDELSEEVKGYLASIQFIDQKMEELKKQMTVYQTARNTYGQDLKVAIKKL